MIASGRAARASGGEISGSGLAIAKMIGAGAISLTISGLSAPAADRPRKTSAPFSASVRLRSEAHTSELQSLMRTSYAVFCLKKKNTYKLTSQQPRPDRE